MNRYGEARGAEIMPVASAALAVVFSTSPVTRRCEACLQVRRIRQSYLGRRGVGGRGPSSRPP
jgi:hypothetical protein